MLPKIAEVGRLWADPEIRWTTGGKAVTSVPLVFSKKTKTEDGGWKDAGSLFVKGTLWDQYAQNVAETLSKGDQVVVIGELYEREWKDKEGNMRKSLELKIFDIGPTLKWNPAKIARADRSSDTGAVAAEADPWATDTEAPF